MRIRKRQIPFPLSSLSPVPLSDPLLNLNLNHPSSPVAVVQLHNCDSSPTKPHNPLRLPHVHPQPSDPPNQHLTPTGSAINGSDITDAGGPLKEEEKNKQDRSELLQEEDVDDDDDDDERGRVEEEKSNDIRKGSILGAEPVTGFLHDSSSSPRVVGRWCEGDKAFPLKKRRGSFTSNGETTSSSTSITTAADNNQKDKKMKAKMKTKMNKKCARKNDDVEEQEDKKESNKEGLDQNNNNNNNNNNAGSAKKRGRGGALMEGSRCSRVNGRGWRCCQQTLVGYSLCEHHLGKGRLRSMTSVRSRSLAGTAPSEYPKPLPLSSSSSLLQEKDTIAKPVMVGDEGKAEDEEEDEKKPLMMTKKRMKLGMVKARSISSLLGQSASTSAISGVDNNGKSLTNFTQK